MSGDRVVAGCLFNDADWHRLECDSRTHETLDKAVRGHVEFLVNWYLLWDRDGYPVPRIINDGRDETLDLDVPEADGSAKISWPRRRRGRPPKRPHVSRVIEALDIEARVRPKTVAVANLAWLALRLYAFARNHLGLSLEKATDFVEAVLPFAQSGCSIDEAIKSAKSPNYLCSPNPMIP